MKTDIDFLSYLAQLFLEWETFRTNVVEKIKTHILCSLFSTIVPFVRKCGRKLIESYRPQMTTRRTRIACWKTKATNTLSEYIMLIAFPLQRWLHERAPVLLYIACLVSCVLLIFFCYLCVCVCMHAVCVIGQLAVDSDIIIIIIIIIIMVSRTRVIKK
jgi:hypothetical protein